IGAEADGWPATEATAAIPWLARYLGPKAMQNEAALYVRMWVEVRQRELLLPSFALLRRYWVSAATLDGLFVAAMTWSLVLGLDGRWIPAVVTIIGAGFCLREALRYDDYQREELVATVLQAYDLLAEARAERIHTAELAARTRSKAPGAPEQPAEQPAGPAEDKIEDESEGDPEVPAES
ncbi:MAG: hypothetical protein KC457_23375, partial [Myxococcales bacterium]|nr:hypothetical protein [Myxococcales bacterium]